MDRKSAVETQMEVRAGNELSKCADVMKGVPQGCDMSPIIFRVYSDTNSRYKNDTEL